ncbi:MAG: hypothetical protein EXR47_04925 [Dehalococcoidia bacterium]|nr:hypothetical protein [Dehalococcoidia bacterium]
MAGLRELRGQVAIVGAGECDDINAQLKPDKSVLRLHAEASHNASVTRACVPRTWTACSPRAAPPSWAT